MTITISTDGLTEALNINENLTAIGTVQATDPALVGPVTYSLGTGFDAAKFEIDSQTGALVFKAAPDYETPADIGANNTYSVLVTASDGSTTDTLFLTVTIDNVNEAPVITSDGGDAAVAFMVDETVSTVTEVTATDVDAGTALVYTISGGADAALFSIDAATGLLTFNAAPDVNAPADAGANNVYDVVVKASDGTLFDTQALAISVAHLIDGSVKADKLTGTSGADHLRGFGGKDELTGLAGNDVLDGGASGDKMTGGLGDDTYIVDNTSDKAIETSGEGTDTVLASSAQHKLASAVENLTFSTGGTHSGGGNDLNNVLTGNIGNDTLRGNAGDDTIIGLEGNDNLAGGAGNDIHDGGAGNDAMSGGAGNDTYVVDAAGDKVQEANGKGNDTVLSSITYTLTSNVEALTLTGSDAINGKGNAGANTITGNLADNILNGAAGNDTLSGGLGKDTLIGGKGADTFLFASALNGASNVDVVSDFSTSQADHIALSKAVFAALGSVGTLSQAEFYASASATTAHDANDRIIYNTTTGNLYYDADGFGGAVAVQFATIGDTAHPALVFADFAIVA